MGIIRTVHNAIRGKVLITITNAKTFNYVAGWHVRNKYTPSDPFIHQIQNLGISYHKVQLKNSKKTK